MLYRIAIRFNSLIVIFLFIFQNGYSQCEECLKSLELMSSKAEVLNNTLTFVSLQKDSLITKTKALQNELQEYKLGLKLPFNLKKPEFSKPTKGEISVQPITSASIEPSSPKKNNLVEIAEINKLKNRVLQLNREIGFLKKTIKTKSVNEKVMIKRISGLKDSVSIYENQIELLAERNKVLLSRLECVDNFIKESKIPEQIVLSKLKENRDKFVRYKNLVKNVNSDKEKVKNLMYEIVETYKGYKGEMRTTMCGDIELSYYCDYLTVEDYQNIAEIYGKNLEGSVYLLEGVNKINASNRIILDSAGKIMENGNYEQRGSIANNLTSYITRERKEITDLSEVRINIEKVYSLYKESKYLEALILFDKYEKFLSDPDLKDSIKSQTMLSVGVILLWDLANIQHNVNIYNFGDWASKGGSLGSTGKDYLIKLTSEKNTPVDIRKDASIALSKYYHE